MAKFCKFPEEMVVQFLSRLPPKALMRFKCVRKSWYHLINSPRFVAKNLSNSINNKFASSTSILFKRTVLKDNTIKDKKEILVILNDGSTKKKESLLSLLDLCNDNYCNDQNLPSVVDDLIVPLPTSRCPFSLHIAGHCDGIICLKGIDKDIVLCNPAIKEFKYLPESCLLLPPNDSEDDYDAVESYSNAVGFGYDSKAKNYKVVRVVHFSGDFVGPSKRAEVYTLGANSWREIQADIRSHVFWTPSFVIYFKGISYWYACTPEDKESLLSFNMSDELFHDIPLPNCFDMSDGCRRSLAVLRDQSIVLLTYEGVREIPNSFDIWMLDDTRGVKEPWTKYLTFVPIEGIEIPLVFLKSDELLMVTRDGRVVFFNISTDKHNYLPIHGVEDPKYIQATVYINSIVSVQGDNKPMGNWE